MPEPALFFAVDLAGSGDFQLLERRLEGMTPEDRAKVIEAEYGTYDLRWVPPLEEQLKRLKELKHA